MAARSAEMWLRKAKSDRRACDILSIVPEPPWDIVCFHAQQEAEKLLKATLSRHDVHPERTHDLAVLLVAVERAGIVLGVDGGDARLLSPFAVALRYPGDPDEPTEARSRQALVAVARIRAAVFAHFDSLVK